MIPEEEIIGDIKNMGYVIASPRKVYPSYYRLADRTVLKIVVNINYLLPAPQRPEGFNINQTNIISAHVPKEKRKPEAFVPYTPAEIGSDVNIIEEDVEFDVLQENFSVYDLSNGFVLSLKPVLGQVKKTKFYTTDGEPLYTVNINPVLKLKKK